MWLLSSTAYASASEAGFDWHRAGFSASVWSFEADVILFFSLAALGSLAYLYGALAACVLDVLTSLETSSANVGTLTAEALGPVIRALHLIISIWT